MEYLEGESVNDLIDRVGKVDIKTATYIIAQVLSALCAAHAKGIIHRDLKPENIYLVETGQPLPEVKILDFGTSKMSGGSQDDAPRLTQSGTILGTPYYMAPEQIRAARHLDHRLDIYAVGVTFYEAVTGQVPFDSNNVYTLVHKVLHEELIPPRTFNGDLSPELEAIILKAMERDRELRFGSAAEMLSALLPHMDELTMTRVSVPAELRATESRRREQPTKPVSELTSTEPLQVWPEQELGSFPTFETEAPLFREAPRIESSSLVMGKYAPLRRLATTDVDTVFLAFDEGMGHRKPVAIRVIHPHVLRDMAMVRAFIQEARMASRLVHPNIVQVLDYGEHVGQYLTVMEYVHGYRISAFLRHLAASRRSFSIEHALYVAIQTLEGLGFMHGMTDERGASLELVHGGITPDSLLISTDGQVKLTDLTMLPNSTVGSVTAQSREPSSIAYRAPEQLSGDNGDRRADLYTVGVLLYELIAGRHPLGDTSLAYQVAMEQRHEIRDIRAVRPDCPPALSALIAHAMAVEPSARLQNATIFAAELRRMLGGRPLGELESSFRAEVTRIVSERGFSASSGELFDLSEALREDSISIDAREVEAAVAQAAAERDEVQPRSMIKVLVVLVVTLVLLSATAVGISLYVLSDSERRPPGADRPLALIIDQRPAADEASRVVPSADDDADIEDPLTPNDASSGDASDSGDPGTDPNGSRPPQPLTSEMVVHTLGRYRGRLERCLRHAREAGGGSVGIHHLVVVVEGDGSVSEASVEPESVLGTPFGQCVIDVARSIRFPRHPATRARFRVRVRLEAD
jgi:serine/threonine protein kinase